jgi:hypothetical protein
VPTRQSTAPSRQPVACPRCGKQIATSYGLTRHIERRHPAPAPAPEPAPEPTPARGELVTADGRPLELTTAADLWPGDQVEWTDGLIRSVTAVPKTPGVVVSVVLDGRLEAKLGARTPVRRVAE